MTDTAVTSLPKETMESYDEVAGRDRLNLINQLAAPTLFSWFVGLTAIIVALCSILPLRLLEVYQVGQLSAWLLPIRIWLLLGGVGLIYTEIRPEKSRLWNIIFRGSLVIAFFSLALLSWQSLDLYGVSISGLIGALVLLELVAEVSTLKSFAIYSGGLMASLWLASYGKAGSSLWQSLDQLWPWLSGWQFWLIGLVAVVWILLLIWYYFAHKQRLSYLIGLTAVPVLVLAFFFAGESEWQKTFVLIMSALFVGLVPFWDEFNFRRTDIRDMVARMFGGLLGIFGIVIVLIYIAQNLIVQNVSETLQDKVTYGKIQTDLVAGGVFSAVREMSKNPLLLSVMGSKKDVSSDLLSLSRNLYESNQNVYKVMVVDQAGTILADYPTDGAITPTTLADQEYFRRGLANAEGFISGLLSNFEGSGRDVIAAAWPIKQTNGQVSGVLIGYLNVSRLNDSLSTIATPRTKQYFVLQDEAGQWLLWPNALANVDKKSGDVLVREESRNGLVRRGYARDGYLSLAAGQTLNTNRWQITIVVPFFEALSVKQTAYIAVLIIGGLSLLAIGLTVVSGRVKKTI